MKKYHWIIIISAIWFIAVVSGCKIMEEFKVDDFSVFDEDNGRITGVDGVKIDEYTKDGVVVRMFCNEETGLIKLKMGAAVEDVKNLDSEENIKEAMKMPESDYMHLGGGFVDMVITVGAGPKGHTMNLHGIGIYVVGSEDTKEDLDKLKNIDFVYTPCSYNSAKVKAEKENNDRLDQIEKRQHEVEEELNKMKEKMNRRQHDIDAENNRALRHHRPSSDLMLDAPDIESSANSAKQDESNTEDNTSDKSDNHKTASSKKSTKKKTSNSSKRKETFLGRPQDTMEYLPF